MGNVDVRTYGTQVVDKAALMSEMRRIFEDTDTASIVRARIFCRPDKGNTIASVTCTTSREETARHEGRLVVDGWIRAYMHGRQTFGAAALTKYVFSGREEQRSIWTEKVQIIYGFVFQITFAHDITQAELFDTTPYRVIRKTK